MGGSLVKADFLFIGDLRQMLACPDKAQGGGDRYLLFWLQSTVNVCMCFASHCFRQMRSKRGAVAKECLYLLAKQLCDSICPAQSSAHADRILLAICKTLDPN